MIDYLEELLEEETAVDLEGRPLALVGRKKRVRQEDEENPENEDPIGWLGGTEPAGRRAPEFPGDGSFREPQTVPWAETAEQERRTAAWLRVSRGSGTGAARLTEDLKRAERTARQAGKGQGAVTVSLPGNEVAHKPVDILALDRAVQRDARRYDGGFSLY